MLFFFLVFRQDSQDYLGLFFNLSHFPDGSEKTQSTFSGKLISLVGTISSVFCSAIKLPAHR
jgi:hypothetical protein